MKDLLTKLELFFPKSLIVEYAKIFGIENTERFLAVFGGQPLKVPSIKDIRRMERDIAIFKTIFKAESRAHKKILEGEVQAKFGLKKKDVKEVYKQMKKLARLSARILEEDKAASKLRRRVYGKH